ncbi:MAG: hemolysin family protein [Eubacteriales bacterium]|nr:hemolysin family protein [Eubacteriales bacterium]
MTLIFVIIGIIVCIALSAFFSASEMSMNGISELRMESLLEKGEKRAAKALNLIRNFDDTLSTILIGNNLVNIASSSLTSVMIILVTGSDKLTWVGTLVITVLIIICGETIPKITAKKNANRFALTVSGILSLLKVVLYPLVWLSSRLVHLITDRIRTEKSESEEEEAVEEFSSIIETAEDEGVLDEDRSELVQNALDFADISAQECMTSRVDMEAIDIDDPMEEIIGFVEKTAFTRIPVYEDSIDNIIGIIHLNKLLKLLSDGKQIDKSDLRAQLLKPCYVYKTMPLPVVLKRMREANQHLAIVTDEYSGTEGIITLEDVLEEIVGEIWDETDTVEMEMVKIGDNQFIIDGDMPIGDFLEEFGLDEDDFDFDSETVGGWAIEFLENFPRKGDLFDYESLHVEVLGVDGLRVENVAVTKDEDKEDEEDS